MNNLKDAIDLLVKCNTELENRNAQSIEFNEQHNQLVDDYEAVCDEFDALRTTVALSAASNKALLKELEDTKKSLEAVEVVNAYLSKQNEELQKDAGYKRKYTVASNDLRKAQAQVKRLKAAKSKAKPVKASVLSRVEKERDEYKLELDRMLKYNKTAPVWAWDIKCQGGTIEMVDLQWKDMTVEVEGEKQTKRVQRMLLTNNYNSVLCVMRMEGMAGVHTIKVPEGGDIKATDDLFDSCQQYFDKYDEFYGVER